mgnify:CR=1 FL=1
MHDFLRLGQQNLILIGKRAFYMKFIILFHLLSEFFLSLRELLLDLDFLFLIKLLVFGSLHLGDLGL